MTYLFYKIVIGMQQRSPTFATRKKLNKKNMKKLVNIRVMTGCLVGILLSATAYAKVGKKDEGESKHARQILIIGLQDNVRSNYFYNGLIAEETGLQPDSIDQAYNRIIAENIAAASAAGDCRFIPASAAEIDGRIRSEIKVTGESDESRADLSAVPADAWEKCLSEAGADYLLILNQHYLKWQDQPFRTLFHIVSYSLFDREKKEVCSGNNYFTCMNLEKPDKLRKISRKSSSKIASSIIRTLDEE